MSQEETNVVSEATGQAQRLTPSRSHMAKMLHEDGRSVEQIAEHFGKHPGTVKTKLGSHAHSHYVYHEGADVMARRGAESPVLVKTCGSPQAAHDVVQSIVNPKNVPHHAFGTLGYLSDEFQSTIPENCRSVVEAAYGQPV